MSLMGFRIVLHNPHFAVGATQTVHVLPGPQQRAAIFRVALRTGILPDFASATVHTSSCDRITRPICTPCQPTLTPDLGAPFFLKPSRPPYRRIQMTGRCGSMQARRQKEVNDKLYYLLVLSASLAASCQKSCPFVGAIDSAFRRLTH